MKLNLFKSKAWEVVAVVNYCKAYATQEIDEFNSITKIFKSFGE